MAYDREKAVAALAAFQQFTGLKDDPWEKASDVGERTLDRFRKGKTRTLRIDTYDKLAAGATKLKGVNFQAAHILGEAPLPQGEEKAAEPQPEGTETIGQTAVMGVQQVSGRPDIPLWASAAAGDEGAMVLVPDPIDYLRRSERMLNVRNPFAFNVLGGSMSPAINHGDQVVINPSIVARPGHDCVFIHEGPEGMLALVKQLVRPGTDHWRVRQFTPAKDFDISRKKWARVHPIAEVRKAGVG
jgi:phage repressor protein C with HTH and peptisase S24 domain